jgi:selenocysteine-specific elongation factor
MQEAFAGQRAALNLQGIEKEDLDRGDVVVTPGRFRPAAALDVQIELLKGASVLKAGDKVHFHLATSETVARIVLYGKEDLKEGESCYGQARLKDPVVAQGMDRFVIRRFSPLETIGGGCVLDPQPARRRRKDTLGDLVIYEKGVLREKLAQKISKAGINGMERTELEGWIKAELKDMESALGELVKEKQMIVVGETFIHAAAFDLFREKISGELKGFHRQNPLKPGMPKEELRAALRMDPRLFAGLVAMVPDVAVEKELARLKAFQPALSGVDEATRQKIVKEQQVAGFQPLFREELAAKLEIEEKKLTDILKLMAKEGGMVRMTDSLYITRETYGRMISLLRDFFSRKPEMTVAEFRDVLGTTRKYALPFLEYLDSNKITLRVGDVRKFLLK